jgi:hypothetical protein
VGQIKDLRMKITPGEIKGFLAGYGVMPVEENDKEIVFPTCCHNHTGGSPKLYYYKSEHIFKCYTQCRDMFDIFTLLQKMNTLRGINITIGQAIKLTGVDSTEQISSEIYKDLEYLKKLSQQEIEDTKTVKILDKSILERYRFHPDGCALWLEEGISEGAMRKFGIGYDFIHNAITIPNYDDAGNLIGIRGRFLNPDAPAKYMPMKFGNDILSHPTGKFLWGYHQNGDTIRRKKIAVIFEGEKSVMKMEGFYPGNNISLATLGKKITLDQLDLLLSLEPEEVMLAYDKDYTTKEEMKVKIEEYEKIVSILKPYFKVSLLMDVENNLGYKDSPADKGKAVFEELVRYRLKR